MQESDLAESLELYIFSRSDIGAKIKNFCVSMNILTKRSKRRYNLKGMCQMYTARLMGCTLDQCGKIAGVTRQRAKQVIDGINKKYKDQYAGTMDCDGESYLHCLNLIKSREFYEAFLPEKTRTKIALLIPPQDQS